MSPEGVPHSYTNRSVADYLRSLLNDIAIVREAHPVTLDNSEPEADLAIVRLPKEIYKQHHPYPKDIYWLIEVRPTACKAGKVMLTHDDGTSVPSDARRKTKDLSACTRTFEISNRTLDKRNNRSWGKPPRPIVPRKI